LHATQKKVLQHITSLRVEHDDEVMHLDQTTLTSLEIVASNQPQGQDATLVHVLEKSMSTNMGKRLLKQWLVHPLTRVDCIQQRLVAVAVLHRAEQVGAQLAETLIAIGDIQRALGKIGLRRISPRELVGVKQALSHIPHVLEITRGLCAKKNDATLLAELAQKIKPLPELIALIEQAIMDEPAAVVERGGIIRTGYNHELDELRSVSGTGKDWIKQLEHTERDRTGISSLKVRYTSVFGYYIEVTNTHLKSVPPDYIRKQTLVNAERFITPALKEKEAQVLGAEERIIALEQQLYTELLDRVAGFILPLQHDAEALAQLDVLLGLALVARRHGYVQPVISDDDRIEIHEGRHPVLEHLAGGQRFVPNDTLLSSSDQQILVITGPNMAGKSTYLRQVALIVLMAQIGSFVPARAATIGIVDRIFTRVGASDNLAAGQSTFMVEMQETANILHHATERSLIILDEIGRGTSTFDGLAIAWAVVEYLHGDRDRGPRTLFATHYHELIELADDLPRVHNFNVAVREHDGKVIFLYTIQPGGVDRSYGVQVAQLAGLPPRVIERALEVLLEVEQASSGAESALKTTRRPDNQLTLFAASSTHEERDVIEHITNLDVDTTTPLDALKKLSELKKKLKRSPP
jgi:DNA mismatch repair protein MutS